MNVVIETKRLKLHATTIADAELLLAVWNDPDFIRNVADRGIRTVEQARDAIQNGAEEMFAEYGYGPYCVSLKADESMIGICGIFRREILADPDIGFGLLPAFCGQGYALEAARAVIEYARETLNLTVLNAIVSPGNAPSRKLIEKLGLNFERMIAMSDDEESICLYSMALAD